MDKSYRRWYEQNEYLHAFMDLMQDLDEDVQSEIALGMLMKTASISNRDYSKMLEEISTFDPKDYNRWYDVTPNIHFAIESLRDLEEEQRVEVIQEFIDKVLEDREVFVVDYEPEEADEADEEFYEVEKED